MVENFGDVVVTPEEIAKIFDEERDDFLEVMELVQDIIDNPHRQAGNPALTTAAKLASFRTKLGVQAQLYKTGPKTVENRRRKDVLLTLYNALEENINTLKLLGKVEAFMVR